MKNEIKKLQGTPWHIDYIKKEEDDPRRHKARCAYCINNTCRNPQSFFDKKKCGGSSHCMCYSETFELSKYSQLLSESKKLSVTEKNEKGTRELLESYRRLMDIAENRGLVAKGSHREKVKMRVGNICQLVKENEVERITKDVIHVLKWIISSDATKGLIIRRVNNDGTVHVAPICSIRTECDQEIQIEGKTYWIRKKTTIKIQKTMLTNYEVVR